MKHERKTLTKFSNKDAERELRNHDIMSELQDALIISRHSFNKPFKQISKGSSSKNFLFYLP